MKYDLNYKGVTSSIEAIPKCNAVAVSHSAFCPPELRGKGLGTEANLHRIAVANDLGFHYLIATVRGDNERQHKVMTKNGWKKLAQTDTLCHNVTLYGRQTFDVCFPTLRHTVE